jgi:hypothetical protein
MRLRVFGKALTSGVCAVLVLGGAVAVIATPASAVTSACDPDDQRVRGDLDGDQSPDAIVGMPWYSDAAGAVDVRYTAHPSVLLTDIGLGAGTGEGDNFGSAIAVGDLDGDGCSDLVIGASAEGQSAATDGAGGNEGQVHIVFGSPTGVDPSTAITLPHDSANLNRFGISLALVGSTNGTATTHDLYVGAPGTTINGHDDAGEVFRYTITPATTGRIKATLREVRSQDSPGVPGTSETADGFGTVLAASDDGRGVWVGAPNEDIGKARDAGAVWFLRVNAAGAAITSQSWSQDTASVPGVAEAEDHFGTAITSRGDVAVVGVPDENDGTRADAGMVQVFKQNASTRAYAVSKAITQDTTGIPGVVEAGDRFGAAVAAGAWLLCQEAVDVAIGAPGEDIGSHQDAGSITLDSLTDNSCPAKAIHQGSGLAGAAETDDQVGTVLGLTRGATDLEEDYSDRLLIGVPYEDLGAVPNAGMVQPSRFGITSDHVYSTVLKFSKGYLNSQFYGLVLSSPSD